MSIGSLRVDVDVVIARGPLIYVAHSHIKGINTLSKIYNDLMSRLMRIDPKLVHKFSIMNNQQSKLMRLNC
ncbi:hypothetical protein Scep_019852 [Stephania cephalantha]|uniref:Uncharacterized protein n=1 Tax=Stephania cephalantha TaxID=152367 RepID=A0AAP0IBN9_9MAGN